MLPDLERADRIGEFWGYPVTRTFGELLIDLEEDKTARAVVFGLPKEMERTSAYPPARRGASIRKLDRPEKLKEELAIRRIGGGVHGRVSEPKKVADAVFDCYRLINEDSAVPGQERPRLTADFNRILCIGSCRAGVSMVLRRSPLWSRSHTPPGPLSSARQMPTN
jgi:hypothetical protein